jgi:hypothetical protein
MCLSSSEVQLAFVKYFVGLFTTENVGNRVLCLQPITSQVTEDMNRTLLQPFTAEGVHSALHQMATLKASGLYGFLAEFYQKNWSVVG